jgi:hypothetical protein
MLCDTALVYGFAEQRERIDAQLVHDVASDKQKGGLFPQKRESSATKQAVKPRVTEKPVAAVPPGAPVAVASQPGRAVRVAITAESELQRLYLSRLLGKFNIDVVATVPLKTRELRTLDAENIDVLLVELDDHIDRLDDELYELLEEWKHPVLFNDSLATEASLSQKNRNDYGRKLSQKLYSLVRQAPQSVA